MNVNGLSKKDLERVLAIGPSRLHKTDIDYILSEIYPISNEEKKEKGSGG